MAAATGSSGGFTLADFFNVIHFQLDEGSVSAAEQAIANFKANAEEALNISPCVDEASASDVVDKIKETVEQATEQGKVPVEPKVDPNSEKKVIDDVRKLKSTITKIMGVIGLGFSLTQFRQLTEEFNGINDKINYATRELSNQKEVQQDILKAANDCKAAYGDLADYAVTLKEQNADLFPIEDATQFAKLVNQAEQGAGNSENISTVKTLLGTVFATGELTEATLNRLAKNAPEVVNILCDGLGVTRDELDKLAASGKIGAEDIKNAYFNSADAIQETYDNLDYSISDGLTAIRNTWGYKLDEMNVKFGITEKVARGMVKISEIMGAGFDVAVGFIENASDAVGGFDNLVAILTVAVGAFFAAWKGEQAVKTVRSIVTAMQGLNLSILPTVAAVVALFLVLQDLWTFLQGGDSVIGQLLEGAGVDVDKLRETVLSFFENAKALAADALAAMGQWWSEHSDEVKEVFQALFTVVQGLFTALVGIVSGVFGAISDLINGDFDGAVASIGEMFDKVFEGIDQAARALFGDALVDAVEGFVDWALGILGGIADFIGGIANSVGSFVNDPLGTIGGAIGNFFGGGSSSDAVGTVVEATNQTSTTNNNTVQQNNTNNFYVSDREVAGKASEAVDATAKKASDKIANDLAHTGR